MCHPAKAPSLPLLSLPLPVGSLLQQILKLNVMLLRVTNLAMYAFVWSSAYDDGNEVGCVMYVLQNPLHTSQLHPHQTQENPSKE